jgi:hypothetical protein
MKTSKIILLFVAAIIMVSFVIIVVIMKNNIQSARSKAGLRYNYKTVSVHNFENLDLSSHFIVRIKQGKECEVEIITERNSLVKPNLENINGTLHCMVDSTAYKNDTGSIQLRITMPFIKVIKATQGTEIYLANFQSDSISVFLGNGCVFKGNNNTLKRVSFKTAGDAVILITSTF